MDQGEVGNLTRHEIWWGTLAPSLSLPLPVLGCVKDYPKVSQTNFSPWDDPNGKPLIRFENITKKFGEFVAIDDLTLDIYEREFFALLGPSGCGKTTMMRMLAGFENPTSGKMELAGKNIAGIPPNKRAVNMMFQSYALFPHLTVWDNIAFGLRRGGASKQQIEKRVEEMLTLTRMTKFARRKPHQISGGQRQRVALARSLAKAPKLLLLDEPLGALDKKLRQDTQFELMDIQESTGTTFVIVTHDQEEAMTVASRVAVMDEGRIIQVATPDRIYPNQAPLLAASERPFSDGQTAHLAIRPEKITISAEQPVEAKNTAKGSVLDIAYLGNLSTYYVQLDGGQVVKAQTANTRRLSRRSITWEDKVWISWSATAGVLLDR